MKKITTGQLVFALFLLAIGSVLLLINLDIISFTMGSIYLLLYPFIILMLGLYWSFNGFIDRRSSKVFWGLFTLIFAGLLIADRFGKIDFGFWDVFKLWPFFIIYFAINLLIGRKKSKFVVQYSSGKSDQLVETSKEDCSEAEECKEDSRLIHHSETTPHVNIDEILEIVERQIEDEQVRNNVVTELREKIEQAIKPDNQTKSLDDFVENDDLDSPKDQESTSNRTTVNVLGMSVGDYEYKSPNWPLKPLKLENTIVNYYMDFTKAYIPEGETPVVLKGKIGDIEILIPEDVSVRVSVKNSIGDVSIFGESSPNVGTSKSHFYESEDYEEALKKINFQITLSIGSVQIDQV